MNVASTGSSVITQKDIGLSTAYIRGLCFLFVSDWVLLGSYSSYVTPMTPGTVWLWICQAATEQVSWHIIWWMPHPVTRSFSSKFQVHFKFQNRNILETETMLFPFLCLSTLTRPVRERWAGLRRTGPWGYLDGFCKRWRSCRFTRSDCQEKTNRSSCRLTTSKLALKSKL